MRRKTSTDMSTMVYGKVPPQAKELEEAVLGAIMLEKSAFDIAAEILDEECFYVDAHQKIFRAFKNLVSNSIPVDILTVVEALKASEELDAVGGPYYVTKLTNSVVSTAHLDAHCRIVVQKFIQRELIRISGEIIGAAYEDGTDVFDLFDMAEDAIYKISNNHFKKDYSALGDGVPEYIRKVEVLRHQEESVTGVPSGFPEMDKVTHGWQPTDLIILAARPSVGKTAFALNLARNAIINPIRSVPVGFFSLEMSKQQLLQRMISMDSGIWMERLSTGRIDDTTVLMQSGDRMIKMPFYIDDTAALNSFELRAKARRMVNKHKVGVIIIDYLQLMSGDRGRSDNREQEISSISRNLKKLAKELNVPIIALSQLSRKVEDRGKGQKVPQLSDLRESGAIEQDADMVMFLYRPPEDEVKDDIELADKAMSKIAKHRNGKLESFAFEVDNNIQRWKEIGLLDFKPTNWVPVKKDAFPAVKGNQKPSVSGPPPPADETEDLPF
ncbi:MAG: replicative DNA helicase [Bacteroidota bacterium]